jgi:putative salt-induced outer membrane protein
MSLVVMPHLRPYGCAAAVLWLALLASVPAPLQAEEPPDGWTGDVELSFVNAGGNTDSMSLSFGAKAELALTNSRLRGEAKTLYSEQNGASTARNYLIKGQYDVNLSARTSFFVSGSVERDVPKGLQIRDSGQLGLGHTIVKTARQMLRGEVSAGYIYERLIFLLPNPVPPPPLTVPVVVTDGYLSARLGGEYTYFFTPHTRFVQTAELLMSLEEAGNYLINEESALVVNLFGQLALKMSFAVNYDHQPQPGFGAVDRLLKTSLLYTF